MHNTIAKTSIESISKPRGGYRIVSVPQICLIWRAYKSRLLPKFYDVRVYFALHEIDERRAAETRKRRRSGKPGPRFAYQRDRLIDEIQEILEGLNPRLIRASLRRLQRSGLVRITRYQIEFAHRPCQLPDTEVDGFQRMLQRIDRREKLQGRAVPIPRRMLRFLARDATPGVAATLLGHALRCLWLHRSTYRFVGTCPARFVAEVFDTNRRTVIRARQLLSSPTVRWLVSVPTAPHVQQRYGSRMAINPRWERPVETRRRKPGTASVKVLNRSRDPIVLTFSRYGEQTALSPSTVDNDTEMALPIETKNLPKEVQEPGTAAGGRSGVCGRDRRRLGPSLDDVTLADLESTQRLAHLLAVAQSRGWVGRSDADRLAFFAAAEHALRVGTRNPPGLFVAVVRRKLWHHITQDDEDAARRRLARIETHAGLLPPESISHSGAWRAGAVPMPGRQPQRRVEQLVSRVARAWDLVRSPAAVHREQGSARGAATKVA